MHGRMYRGNPIRAFINRLGGDEAVAEFLVARHPRRYRSADARPAVRMWATRGIPLGLEGAVRDLAERNGLSIGLQDIQRINREAGQWRASGSRGPTPDPEPKQCEFGS